VIAQLPARLWTLIFPLRALDGAGAAALWPPLFAMVGDLVRDRSRAAAMSVINTIYVGAIGGAIALGAVSVYLTHTNKAPFYLVTVLLVVSAAIAYFGIPKSVETDLDPDAADSAAATACPASAPPPGDYPLPLVLLVSVLMTLGVLMLPNFLIVYVQTQLVNPLIDSGRLAAGARLGLTSLYTGAVIGVLGVPVLLLGMPLGHAADRWGKSRAVRLSLTISAAAMWLIPSCRSIPAFTVIAVILVLSHILGTPAWLALVSGLAPRHRRGSVMGIVATAEGVGAVIAPLIGGWLWDIKPAYIFYGSAALLSAAAAVAMHTLRRQHD
jgi:MFS family permease